MKILVPTDFSEFADFAMNAAIKLAKKFNGEVHLFHCIQDLKDFEHTKFERSFKEIHINSLIKMVDTKLQQFKNEVEAHGVPCFCHYEFGEFIADLKVLTEKYNFDLVVVGSHGSSGLKDWYMGSNAQKIVRRLSQNVLIVKSEMNTIDFNEVLFATGLNEEDKLSFKEFLRFLTPFEIEKLHIVAINTPNAYNQPTYLMHEGLEDFKKVASTFEVETHFYADYSIESGINAFIKEKNIQLVGISNHKRHPIRRFFQGSNVEMVVNSCPIPVLTIDF